MPACLPAVLLEGPESFRVMLIFITQWDCGVFRHSGLDPESSDFGLIESP
jgi:hypothetical protein